MLDRALRTFGRADLVLNATVTAVSRPAAGEEEGGGPVLLTYTVAGGGAPATLSCGALLNTAAPTPVGLAYLGGLDTAEAAVFGRVMTNQYTTVAVALDPPLPCSTYVPSASLAATYLAQPGLVATALAAGAFTAAASADGNLSGASWGGLQPSAAAGLPDVPAISAVDDPALSGWPQSYALVCPGAANRPAWTVGNASAPPPRVAVAYSLSDVPLSAAEFAQRATAPFLPGRSATAEQARDQRASVPSHCRSVP